MKLRSKNSSVLKIMNSYDSTQMLAIVKGCCVILILLIINSLTKKAIRTYNKKGDLYFMKKISIFFMALLVMASMMGCGSGSTTKISDLSGTWKQSNSKSDDSYQEAVISGDLIEIYWVSDGGDSKSLYWAGSYIPPTEAVNSYSWDSVNDHSKTDSSLLASGDDSKTFTYEKGEISYSASAMGTTTTVRLEKVEK